MRILRMPHQINQLTINEIIAIHSHNVNSHLGITAVSLYARKLLSHPHETT